MVFNIITQIHVVNRTSKKDTVVSVFLSYTVRNTVIDITLKNFQISNYDNLLSNEIILNSLEQLLREKIVKPFTKSF
jgi:hypothetical protein